MTNMEIKELPTYLAFLFRGRVLVSFKMDISRNYLEVVAGDTEVLLNEREAKQLMSWLIKNYA